MRNVDDIEDRRLSGKMESRSTAPSTTGLPDRTSTATLTRRSLLAGGVAAGIVSAVLLGKDESPEWAMHLQLFLATGGWLNLVLLALNLLPIPPLDGSRILASFSDPYARLMMNPNAGVIGLGIFLLLFWVTDFGLVVFGLLRSISEAWIGMVQGVILGLTGG